MLSARGAIMSNIADYYFTSSVVQGLGRLFFLKVLREAPVDSFPRKLIGSLVDENAYGFLGTRRFPGVEHVWKVQYVLDQIKANPVLGDQFPIIEDTLDHFEQTFVRETGFDIDGKAAYPGLPVSAGLSIDYSQIRNIKVVMKEGSKKCYIPEDFLRSTYEMMAKDSGKYDAIVFSRDRMVIDQTLIVKNMSVTVEGKSSFSTEFDLRATAINDLGAGVKYKRTGDSTFVVDVDDDKEYLFAVGAKQADKYID